LHVPGDAGDIEGRIAGGELDHLLLPVLLSLLRNRVALAA
jgi:hypothetical protein